MYLFAQVIHEKIGGKGLDLIIGVTLRGKYLVSAILTILFLLVF